MIDVILYSRRDCHLCDQAEKDLESLQAEIPHRLVVLDVDEDENLKGMYGMEVPVVKVGPYLLKAPFDRKTLMVTLGAERDRQEQFSRLDENSAAGKWTLSDRFTDWLGRHYMAFFNVFVLIYVGLPFLAPVLMKTGLTGPAGLIYRGYGLVCHQLSYRSFFMFGEQPFYPRAQAEVEGYLTYNQATGLGEGEAISERMAARNYVGDENVGYKVALCERDIAIYGAILLFGIIFVLSGKRIPPLRWYFWILIGILPIAVDGVSQLLSQAPFNFFPERESTPFLRTFTGFLFGFATAWFGYPLVEDTMRETRNYMAAKRRRISKNQVPQAGDGSGKLDVKARVKEPGSD
jgi:uncharacterized membrane protein